MNILLDINVILDNFDEERREKFSYSVEVFDYLNKLDNVFISSSSIDNIEFLKIKDLRIEKGYSSKQAKKIVKYIIKDLIENFKIAKTPSYMEIDYDDIEDSQIIASAQAVDAKVITRDKKMLEKYPTFTISPDEFIKKVEGAIDKNNPSTFSIDFANLKKQHVMYESELSKSMDNVLNDTSFIMGEPVKTLEKNLQEFTGAKHAITCSSGTDALLLAMMALDIQPDDEIITTPFTFIATAETIAFLKAKPVFVDIDEKTYNIDPSKIEAAITSKTKAIMPVSLYGQPADMDAIQAIVDKVEKGRREKGEGRREGNQSSSTFNLQPSSSKIKIIIDGAQSFGSTYKGKTDSNLGDISTTSFFPAKPLGCYGDGGAVFTNDDTLADKMRSLRVHGQSKRYHHQYIGMGGRMDTLQCAVVDVKLKHYKKDLALRQEVAQKYSELLREKGEGGSEKGDDWIKINPSTFILLPSSSKDRTSAWAQYSVRVKRREKVQSKLKEQGIPTAVHYPMPLHLQECFSYLGYKKGDFPISEIVSNEIMSLPMNPYVSDEEIEYIVESL